MPKKIVVIAVKKAPEAQALTDGRELRECNQSLRLKVKWFKVQRIPF